MKKITSILLITTIAIAAITCKKTPDIPNVTNKQEPPTVTTDSISEISNNSATCFSTVTYDGNLDISAHGVCWNTTGNPTLENNIGITDNGTGVGTYISQLNNLLCNTAYHVTAYATNEKGTSYGEIKSFMIANNFIDPRDGQAYETVIIGNQTWMAENLNYKTGNSWCYNNDPANCETYGSLYDWETIMNGETSSNTVPSGVQGICPQGWHLPSDDEWKQLEMQLGMSQSEADDSGFRGTDEGKKMKSTSGWGGNGNGTNSNGFSALPGSYRHTAGGFYNLGYYGNWWSATEFSSVDAWSRILYFSNNDVERADINKASGYSVRCLRD